MKTELKGKRLAVIGQVWPESVSSAAGKRMVQLLSFFKNCGMEIYFGSTAKKSGYSDDLSCCGIKEFEIWLNDSRSDEVLHRLAPDIVMYDRFMTEEQFGWRVAEQCPDAMTVLDTEDLHFLRYARQEMVKKGGTDFSVSLYSERTKRELASIMRCDLSLLISEYERELLINDFGIPKGILLRIPFLENKLTEKEQNNWKSYDEREGFVFIGNFIHEPNWQTVLRLKNEVWTALREKLPQANLHIYGAYPSDKIFKLHNEKEKFLIHGRAEDASEVIGNARVMLAPIAFGAGIKGKFVDAMRAGTPNITTPIGAESMIQDGEWCGFVTDDISEMVEKAALLYTDSQIWRQKQQTGAKLYNECYTSPLHRENLKSGVETIFINLGQHRKKHFLSQVFKHQSVQSTKYMGLWIETKNSIKEE